MARIFTFSMRTRIICALIMHTSKISTRKLRKQKIQTRSLSTAFKMSKCFYRKIKVLRSKVVIKQNYPKSKYWSENYNYSYEKFISNLFKVVIFLKKVMTNKLAGNNVRGKTTVQLNLQEVWETGTRKPTNNF